MKDKLYSLGLLLLILVSASGCADRTTYEETVEVYSRLSNPTEYRYVWHEPEDRDLQNVIELQCRVQGEPCEQHRFILKHDTHTELTLTVKQKNVPFGLFRGTHINGLITLTPVNGVGPFIERPVEIHIRSWLTSNPWAIWLFLGLISGYLLLHLLLWILITKARGRVEIVQPMFSGNFIEIYPPSRWNHFTRNTFSVGSHEGRGNFTIKPEDCPYFVPHTLKFKYGKDYRKRIKAEITAACECYYKYSEPEKVPDRSFAGNAENAPTIADYHVFEGENVFNILCSENRYQRGRKIDLLAGKTLTVVFDISPMVNKHHESGGTDKSHQQGRNKTYALGEKRTVAIMISMPS
ncbi:MAG TPA: hypothetical protein PKW95_20670 [bacterium]|nr:hypothetical protein [bacterium]